MIERIESSSRQIPVRTINAKRGRNEKKFRRNRFETNFVVYSIRKITSTLVYPALEFSITIPFKKDYVVILILSLATMKFPVWNPSMESNHM